MHRDAKLLVTGSLGMVGSALVRRLRAAGYSQLLTPTRHDLDLLDQAAVLTYLRRERPDYLFIAAARVGGIHANNTYRADFIYQNLMIEANLIHGAHMTDIQRLLFLGSSCIYPRDCPQPIKEEYLLTGPLERTNEPYAIAKIAGIKLCENYNLQYQRRYVCVMPTNLYGQNDHYELLSGHVLPALIRKFHLAKLTQAGRLREITADEAARGPIPGEVLGHLGLSREDNGAIASNRASGRPKVEIWGTGTPRREFLYVDDLADACVQLMASDYGGPLINLGCGEDITIRELAESVRQVVGFDGDLVFDNTKPDGTPRKMLDVSRIQALGWRATTSLSEGIGRSYADYVGST